jgi:putative ABC transport system ATP-binding protein
VNVSAAAAAASSEADVEPTAAVVCQGVSKSFPTAAGPLWALRGVDLIVPQGGVTMLVGPSGCGKTTLLSVIAGILARDGGRCHVFGTDSEALGSRDRLDFRARTIGFIFQQFHLLPSLSVIDNVAIPMIINRTPRRAALAAAEALLAQVGLGGRERDAPGTLSGGEQQRVAIARALVHGPRLVVCDEPTSALDHDTGQKIMTLMREIVRERGTTLLIVTHDNRIFPFADGIARMDDGMILGVEAPPSADAQR